MSGVKAWRPIAKVQSQHEVLVCNAAYLGWHQVAIQSALGEWFEAGSKYESRLKYEPTHYQELPSIQALRTGSGNA